MYEATQRQRKLERAIRNRKRRILIDRQNPNDPERLAIDQTRLVILNDEYARFSKAAGLRSQRERMNVAGFGAKEAREAEIVVKERETAAGEAMKFFGASSTDDLKSIIMRGTIKIQGGFASFPDGDALNANIKKVTPVEGCFDVAMHGSPTGVGFGSKKINMSARTLAAVIRHSKGYNGQNIRLLSCSTGQPVKDGSCFAEELANALGVEVTAPNDILYISHKGVLQVGDYGTGGFVTYTPNQRGRFSAPKRRRKQ